MRLAKPTQHTHVKSLVLQYTNKLANEFCVCTNVANDSQTHITETRRLQNQVHNTIQTQSNQHNKLHKQQVVDKMHNTNWVQTQTSKHLQTSDSLQLYETTTTRNTKELQCKHEKHYPLLREHKGHNGKGEAARLRGAKA